MLRSFVANGNALSLSTRNIQSVTINKNDSVKVYIGACTNNLAVIIYTPNGKFIATFQQSFTTLQGERDDKYCSLL